MRITADVRIWRKRIAPLLTSVLITLCSLSAWCQSDSLKLWMQEGKEYIMLERPEDAVRVLKKVYVNSQGSGYASTHLEAAMLLAQAYALNGNYKTAYLLAGEAALLKDSLSSVSASDSLKKMQALLKAESDNAGTMLSEKEQLLAASRMEKEQLLNYLLAAAAAIALVMCIALFVIIRFNRRSAALQGAVSKLEGEAAEGKAFRQKVEESSAKTALSLNAVLGMTRLLADKTADSEHQEYLKAVIQSAGEMRFNLASLTGRIRLKKGTGYSSKMEKISGLKVRILVADEYIYNALVAGLTLKKYIPDAVIKYAGSAAEARIAASGTHDIVVSGLADDGGLWEGMKRAQASLYIIATGYPLERRSEWMNEYISIPYDAETLVVPVLNYIQTHASLFEKIPSVDKEEDQASAAFRLTDIEEALKKNDWQRIKTLVQQIREQVEPNDELNGLIHAFEKMDGQTSYLTWHQSTKKLIDLLSQRLVMK